MNIIEKLNEARKYYKDSYGINLNKKQLKVLNSKDEVVREIFERAEGCTTAASIKAVEYAIKSSNYILAIKYWRKYFMNNITATSLNKCNCNAST